MRQTVTNVLREAKAYILQPNRIVLNWNHAFENSTGDYAHSTYEIVDLSQHDLAECRVCMLGAVALVGVQKFRGNGSIFPAQHENPPVLVRALTAVLKARDILYGSGNIYTDLVKRHSKKQIIAIFDKAIELAPKIRIKK